MNKRKLLAFAGAGAALLGTAEVIRELHTFQRKEYEIISPRIPEGEEIRIVFLSDLHNHLYGERNRKLLDAVRAAAPDLILAGGDMLVAKKEEAQKEEAWDVAADFMKELPGIAPVYHVNGNHEQRLKLFPEIYGDTYASYRKILEEAGVCCLENCCQMIKIGACELQLCGMEVPFLFYKRGHKKQLSMEKMTEIMGTPESDAYRILMVHQPDFAPVYLDWGADLVLSGHLHGGIVRIPGIGAVMSPQLRLFPKYSGGDYKEAGEKRVIVSKGLGTHTINLRLFNPAEMIAIRLKGEKTGKR